MAQKKMLAIDLGASSGRGILGGFDGKKFILNEIHRFHRLLLGYAAAAF